jgi:NTE family protein
VLEPMRKASYRKVDAVVVRPSLDLGHIAAEHARRGPFARKAKGLFARYLRSSALASDAVDADFLSYLLFDSAYCRDLMALGYKDAKAKGDDLAALFQ